MSQDAYRSVEGWELGWWRRLRREVQISDLRPMVDKALIK